MILNDEQIEEQIRALELRRKNLMKLKQLEQEVSALEVETVKLSSNFKEAVMKIEEVVIAHFNVTAYELRSRSRQAHISIPRQAIFYLARRLTDGSLENIGKLYGRDHGTVMHGAVTTKEVMAVDEKFRKTVEELETKCREKLASPAPEI